MLYHLNAEASGKPWNTASVLGELGDAEPVHMASCFSKIGYKSGTRHAKSAIIEVRDADGESWRAELTPRFNFYMSGIGYTHPEWGHGHYKGENALGYDTYDLADHRRERAALSACAGLRDGAAGGAGWRARGRGCAGAAGDRALCASRVQSAVRSGAMSEDLSTKLAAYLADKLGAADLEVSNLARIPGGASRQTYRFRARYSEGGKTHDRALILRRDPEASLIETERTTEYRAYQAFHGLGLPVPEPIALELEGGALERPFFIMEEIENCAVASILTPDPYGAHRDKIGTQFWNILGRIAGADPKTIGLGDLEGARDATELLAPRTGALGKGHPRGRHRTATDRAGRDPLAQAQPAATGAETQRRAWRLSHRQFPL